MFHKVPDGLGFPHPKVEKTGDILFSSDCTHVLSDELFKHAAEGGYRIWRQLVERLQGRACQAGREDFTQQSVVTRLKCHYLVEVHKMVKWVLNAIVHLESW